MVPCIHERHHLYLRDFKKLSCWKQDLFLLLAIPIPNWLKRSQWLNILILLLAVLIPNWLKRSQWLNFLFLHKAIMALTMFHGVNLRYIVIELIKIANHCHCHHLYLCFDQSMLSSTAQLVHRFDLKSLLGYVERTLIEFFLVLQFEILKMPSCTCQCLQGPSWLDMYTDQHSL